MLEGYVINNKRLEKLNKVVEIQNKMLSGVLNVDTQTLENVISKYTSALNLLDAYDHQNVIKLSGDTDCVKISYEECRNIIDQ